MGEVSIFEQISFFVPLAVTSFLITVTHSLFNAGLARLATPEIYISAFAVAKSLEQLLQSPVVMVRQVVTALVIDRQSYYKVKRFISLLVLGVVVFYAIFAYTGIARWVFSNLLGVKGRILDEAVHILRMLIIFPAAVALRSFNQGIAIRFRMTPLITLATIARIIYVCLMVYFVNDLAKLLPGAVIAGLMFLGAICVEALVAFLGVHFSIKNIPSGLEAMKQNRISQEHLKEVTNRIILNFFLPLMITSLMRTLAKPVINAGLARAVSQEIALSAYAVGWNLGMIVISPLNMFHQVSLNFIEGELNLQAVKKFAVCLGIFVSVVMVTISFTDVGYFILRNWICATEEISRLSLDVLRIMCLLPIIIISREYQWGILMKKHQTKNIGRAKIINLVSLIVAIFVLTFVNFPNPAVVGAIGMLFAQSMELISLLVRISNTR